MSFNFNSTQAETFSTEATIEYTDEKGVKRAEKMTAIFKRLPLGRLNELEREKNEVVLQEVLLGWKNVLDDDKREVPFTEEHKAGMLQFAPATVHLALAFWKVARAGKQ